MTRNSLRHSTRRTNQQRRRSLLERLEQRTLFNADFSGFEKPRTVTEPGSAEIKADQWLIAASDANVIAASIESSTQELSPSLYLNSRGTPALADALIVDFFLDVTEQQVAENLGLDGLQDFVLQPMLPTPLQTRAIPNDPYFPLQWHLQNTGQTDGVVGFDANVTSVWDTYQGEGVVIGIVDDGVQYTHPDLAPRYRSDLSYDFLSGDSDARPLFNDSHGTEVAGVTSAAWNNSIGVAGVAPRSEIAGIRLLDGSDATPGATDETTANALLHQSSQIDVLNNSWGPSDVGSISSQSGGLLTQSALSILANDGRDGLGTIIVWAGGNGAYKRDDVNYDQLANSRYTIAVGAVDHLGNRPFYSEPGAALLVSAHSNDGYADGTGITTTDRLGAAGSNKPGVNLDFNDPLFDADDFPDLDYTTKFRGTSASAPVVSGVVALMLEANPMLSWRDVQSILADTASKSNLSDADWQLNGGNHLVSHAFGFGSVDAEAAVNAALSHAPLPPEQLITTGRVDVNQAIPDASFAGISRSVQVNESLVIESVEIIFDASHSRVGDLDIRLVSPTGTVSQLAEKRSDATRDYSDYRFTSQMHRDELSDGEWTIEVSDLTTGRIGTVNDFELRFYGHAPQPGQDRQSPRIASTTPVDDGTNHIIVSDLQINFDEPVAKGNAQITIHRSDHSVFETLDTNSSRVTVAGSTVTIDPAAHFQPESDYYVTIDFDSFRDTSGNPFHGIDDSDQWNFRSGKATGIDAVSIVESLPENTLIASDLRIADISIFDPNGLAGATSLSGDHADLFQVVGDGLFLKAGTTLDFEATPQLTLLINLLDVTGANTLDSIDVTLDLTNVNDAAPILDVELLSPTLSESLDTSTATLIANIDVIDDGGTNNLSLSGPDSSLFSIVDDQLILNAGVTLDAITQSELLVTVAVDDPAFGINPDDSQEIELTVIADQQTIFFDDFESGSLGDHWAVVLGTFGRAEVETSDAPNGLDLGNFHALVDNQSTANKFGSTASMAIQLDITGLFDVQLDFDLQVKDRRYDPSDDNLGVSFDGESFYPLFSFNDNTLGNSYQSVTVNISSGIHDLIDAGVPGARNDGLVTLRFQNRGQLNSLQRAGIRLDNIEIKARPIIGQSPPTMVDQQFSVDEGSTTGTVVGTLSATDPEDDSLSYQIISGDGLELFAIDGNQIIVANQRLLKHQLDASHELLVRVTDDGVPKLFADALVTIDVNDLGLSQRIFEDDFETGQPSNQWDELSGAAAKTDHAPIAGTHHLVLENGINLRRDTLHWAEFSIDAAAWSDLILVFKQKNFGSEYYNPFPLSDSPPLVDSIEGDGLLVSADGQQWHEILGFGGENSLPTSQTFALDISQITGDLNIPLSSDFRFRFSRFATSGSRGNAPDRGIAIDDVIAIGSRLPVVPLTITPDNIPTDQKPIEFTFQFQEDVSGFTTDDIVVTGGTKQTFTVVDPNTYTLSVSPNADGAVTASVLAETAQSTTTGNPNLAATATVQSVTPGINLTGGPIVVAESSPEVLMDGSAEFTVVLNAAPLGELVLDVTPNDFTEVNVSQSRLSFTPDNWDQPQTVTVSGVDDGFDDGDIDSLVIVSVSEAISDAFFNSVPDVLVHVTTIDDDATDVLLEKTVATVTEDGEISDEVYVVLGAQPAVDVQLQLSANDPGEAVATQEFLTFTPSNWDQPQLIEITGVDDQIIDGDQQSTMTVRVVDENSDDAFDGVPDKVIDVTTLERSPRVVDVVLNDGQEQRSQIQSIEVTFDTLVDHSRLSNAFLVSRQGGTSSLTPNVSGRDDSGRTIARLTFPESEHTATRATGNSLVDGQYQLTVLAAEIVRAFDDEPMEANHVFGTEATDRFFRLFGDSDGDGDVDGQDYGRFGLSFLTSSTDSNFNPVFDHDGDDDVDGQDYGNFGLRFLTQIDDG